MINGSRVSLWSRRLVDVVEPKIRSRMMSGIRGKDTKPEMLVRKSGRKQILLRVENAKGDVRSVALPFQ